MLIIFSISNNNLSFVLIFKTLKRQVIIYKMILGSSGIKKAINEKAKNEKTKSDEYLLERSSKIALIESFKQKK